MASNEGLEKKRGRDNGFFKSWAKSNNQGECLAEHVRIDLEVALEGFKNDTSKLEMRFPVSLSSEQRKFLHREAHKLGYNTMSEGKEPNRFIRVTKKTTDCRPAVPLGLYRESAQLLMNYMTAYDDDELKEFPKLTEKKGVKYVSDDKAVFGLQPRVPKKNTFPKFRAHRQSLPIFSHRDEIIRLIRSSPFVCVKGSTGSGKTTQVPQYILEEANVIGRRIQVVVTVPRRIAAITLAERVSEEMGEVSGQSVGYLVRFDSKYSIEKTVLTYCTTGVLLRILSMNPTALKQLTHIIMDEVHERDRFTDFLLTCLKELAKKYPQIRVIIMGADMNIGLFTDYFGGKALCPSVQVSGRLFGIKTYFLDEVLSLFDQERQGMEFHVAKDPPVGMRNRIDILIEQAHLNEAPSVQRFIDMVKKHNFSAMYKHRVMKVGMLDVCKDPNLREELLKLAANQESAGNPVAVEEKLIKMEEYLKTTEPDRVDLDLAARLVHRIHCYSAKEEAILVFLPGLEDIQGLRRILFSGEFNLKGGVEITILHSSIQAKDQKNAFRKPPHGIRKILLSTNISESSITVDDVVHVIDSGRAKEKSFDCLSGVSLLQCVWISKASANQRQGRAGRIRPGFCYRLYSQNRFESLKNYSIPELLRLSLQELCLTAKCFLGSEGSIEQFFDKLPEPPSPFSVTTAIDALKSLGALTEEEKLTELGGRLANLPVDPNLGKALLYSIVFKCLDPVLTIIASLSHRDPFLIPTSGTEKAQLTELKMKYSRGERSDFSVLKNVYDAFIASRRRPNARDFCELNFVSFVGLQMITSIRSQLIAHLRQNRYIGSSQFELEKVNKNSTNWSIVSGVLASCLNPNFVQLNPAKNCYMNGLDPNIKVHQSSVLTQLARKSCDVWVTYNDLTCVGGVNMIKDCSEINTLTLAIFGDSIHIPPQLAVLDSDSTNSYNQQQQGCLILNKWIRIQGERKQLEDVLRLRSLVNKVLLKFFKTPMSLENEEDRRILLIVESLLKSECREENIPVYGLSNLQI